MEWVKVYLSMMVGFLAIDGLWLGLVASNFYKKYIGFLMSSNPNYVAAGLFYAIYLFGLLMLVVIPAHKANSYSQLLWSGALFGLVCYATYDLTSQAVVKNWPLTVTVVDLLWGTLLTTVIASIGFWAAKTFI